MTDLIVTVTFKERKTPHTQEIQLKCAFNLSPTTRGHNSIQRIRSGGIQIEKK